MGLWPFPTRVPSSKDTDKAGHAHAEMLSFALSGSRLGSRVPANTLDVGSLPLELLWSGGSPLCSGTAGKCCSC